MNELLAKIIEVVDKNKHNYKFFIVLISVVIMLLILVPHIYLPIEDKNMLKTEVDLLATISQIDYDAINGNENLSVKYNQLVEQVCNGESNYFGSLFKTDTTSKEKTLKIISGIMPGIFFLGIVIGWFCRETDEDKSFYGILLGAVVAIMFIGAILNYFMMTFKLTIINYTLIPALIIIMVLIYFFGEDEPVKQSNDESKQ